MNRLVLACAAALGAGVMNIVPWGGPTLRAAAALRIPVTEVFNPLLPALAAGLVYALGVAYLLGRREEARLGLGRSRASARAFTRELTSDEQGLRRPGRFWINVALALAVLGAMLSGGVPPAACSWSAPPWRWS